MDVRAHKHLFGWRGLAADGLPCSGWATARNLEDLSQRLADDGVTLLKARPRRLAVRFNTQAAYRFLEQISSLLSAGVPILEALNLIKQDKSSRRLDAIISGVLENVESGLPLSESLASFIKRGDRIILQALMLGERSGKFDEVLVRLLEQRKKSVRARSQLTRAAVYPAVLVFISTAVVVLMMVWAVPEFSAIYADFGAALPAYTLAIVSLSEFIVANGLSATAWFTATMGALFAVQRASPPLRRVLAQAQLHLPIAGRLLRIRFYRRFATDMNLIYRAGMPLGEALSWLPSTSEHPRYRDALEHVCENVSRGLSLNEALAATRFFPSFIVQTIRVGENSGSLEQAFARIERFYDDALENTADKLVKLFEPLLIAVLSLIVGALVVAMYLPMFNLGFVL